MAQSLQAQIKRREKKLLKIASVEVPRASNSSLNRVAAGSKTQIVRKVSSATGVKSKFIRKRIFVKRSTVRTQKAFVTVYAADITAVSLLPSKTLLAKARRGTSRKGVRVAGRQFDGAFINAGRRNGRFQVFKRRGKNRYPIDVVLIPVRDKAKAISPREIEKAHKNLYAKNYAHELDFRLKKYQVNT